MALNYFQPLFDVIRDKDRCIKCQACARQCSNEVHRYDADLDMMISDSQQCVDCQRCVCICPTGALKIVDNPNKFRNNSNRQPRMPTIPLPRASTPPSTASWTRAVTLCSPTASGFVSIRFLPNRDISGWSRNSPMRSLDNGSQALRWFPCPRPILRE